MARSMPKDIRFPVPVEVEKRITERDDPVVLASWLSRATTVSEIWQSFGLGEGPPTLPCAISTRDKPAAVYTQPVARWAQTPLPPDANGHLPHRTAIDGSISFRIPPARLSLYQSSARLPRRQ